MKRKYIVIALTDGESISQRRIVDSEDDFRELNRKAKQATDGEWYWIKVPMWTRKLGQ